MVSKKSERKNLLETHPYSLLLLLLLWYGYWSSLVCGCSWSRVTVTGVGYVCVDDSNESKQGEIVEMHSVVCTKIDEKNQTLKTVHTPTRLLLDRYY